MVLNPVKLKTPKFIRVKTNGYIYLVVAKEKLLEPARLSEPSFAHPFPHISLRNE